MGDRLVMIDVSALIVTAIHAIFAASGHTTKHLSKRLSRASIVPQDS